MSYWVSIDAITPSSHYTAEDVCFADIMHNYAKFVDRHTKTNGYPSITHMLDALNNISDVNTVQISTDESDENYNQIHALYSAYMAPIADTYERVSALHLDTDSIRESVFFAKRERTISETIANHLSAIRGDQDIDDCTMIVDYVTLLDIAALPEVAHNPRCQLNMPYIHTLSPDTMFIIDIG